MHGDAMTPMPVTDTPAMDTPATGTPATDTPASRRKRLASDPRVLRLIPADFASRHLVLPLRRAGRTLSVAMADPSDAALIDDLEFLTQFEIEAVRAGEHTLRQRIDRSYEAATTRGDGRAEGVVQASPAQASPVQADSAEAGEEPAVRRSQVDSHPIDVIDVTGTYDPAPAVSFPLIANSQARALRRFSKAVLSCPSSAC